MLHIQALADNLQKAGIHYLKNEPLSSHTTFKIGGPAALFCTPNSTGQLQAAISAAKANKVPFTLLGKGSNVLFVDSGFPGLVVHITQDIAPIKTTASRVIAPAGAKLADVCTAAQQAGLAGLEFAFGIPGSVGGAVYMNAGAFDGDISKVLESVDYIDENGKIQTATAHTLALGYRTSVFHSKDWCIISATFALQPGDENAILTIMQNHMLHRTQKQPLELPSAGSAFKRPPGAFAGALIDESGLRGFRVGDAAISQKHCGFIVNLGNATCADVLSLAQQVCDIVKEKTGYTLEKEIRVIGSPAMQADDQ